MTRGVLYMRKKLWRVWAWGLSAVTAGTAAASQLSLTAMAADNNQDYRRKVVGIAGIIQNVSTELDTPVTRAQFAHMLVQASGYRDYLPSVSKVSVRRCAEGILLRIQHPDCGRGKLDDRISGRKF